MKILCVGDPHFRLEYPYGSSVKDGRRAEWDSVLKFIHEKALAHDAVVLLGDNLNLRHNHSSVNATFVEFLKGFKEGQDIYILIGNHERYADKTALDFLEKFGHKNWHVVKDIQNLRIGEVRATFVPYMTPGLLGVQTNEQALAIALSKMEMGDVSFFHHGISGAKTTSGQVMDHFNEIIFPSEVLEAMYDASFAGHVHEPMVLKNTPEKKVVMTGSLFSSDVGEHKKYLWSYDTRKREMTQIENTHVRGIYKVEVDHTWNIKTIPNNSIVKCYLRNRDVNRDALSEMLSHFDAYTIIEQYPDEREKIEIAEGSLDLSIDNLLKLFADSKKIDYNELKEAYELLSL